MRLELTQTTLPHVIKQLIEDADIQKTELAEEIGISRETLNNWVADKHLPRTEQLLWFIEAIGCQLVVERKR